MQRFNCRHQCALALALFVGVLLLLPFVVLHSQLGGEPGAGRSEPGAGRSEPYSRPNTQALSNPGAEIRSSSSRLARDDVAPKLGRRPAEHHGQSGVRSESRDHSHGAALKASKWLPKAQLRAKAVSRVITSANRPNTTSGVSAARSSGDQQQAPLKVLLYTMDSIVSYGLAAAKGGPAGEILIRKCLTAALSVLGYTVHVVGSDQEFFSAGARIHEYTYIIVDPWTVYGKGWSARPFLTGREQDTFVLDFFGSPRLAQGGGLGIDPRHLLTANPTKWNTYLGFFFPPQFPLAPSEGDGGLVGVLAEAFHLKPARPADPSLVTGHSIMQQHGWQYNTSAHGWTKPRSYLQKAFHGTATSGAAVADAPPPLVGGGIIWGKKPEYLNTAYARGAIDAAAQYAVLGSTASSPPPGWLLQLQQRGRVQHLEHVTPEAWRQLLCHNAFLLGLGDPLAGPSAWEAVACGAAFIDVEFPPHARKGVQGAYRSQHPTVGQWVPRNLVCSAQQSSPDSAGKCAKRIMGMHVSPAATHGQELGFIPEQLTAEEYLRRVEAIFGTAKSRQKSQS